MGTIIYANYAAAHVLLTLWAVWLWRTRQAPGALILAVLSASSVYDATIVAIGSLFGPGPQLEMLSWPRFAAATLLPLQIVAALQIATAAEIRWAGRPSWQLSGWILTGLMIAYAFVFRLIDIELQPACFLDTVRYVTRSWPSQFCFPDQLTLAGLGPPWDAIISAQVTLILGILIMLRSGWQWLFIGAILIPVFSLTAPTTEYSQIIIGGILIVYHGLFIMTAAHFSGGPGLIPGYPPKSTA